LGARHDSCVRLCHGCACAREHGEPVDPPAAEPLRARRRARGWAPCDDGGVTELVPLRRNRDFVLYQSGQLLSQFGSNFSRIAYPLLTLAVTGSAAKTGYVGAVEMAPIVLLAAPAGVAADRYDRRTLCIAADV